MHVETICSNNARLERVNNNLPLSGRTRQSNSASNHSGINRTHHSASDSGSAFINGDVEHAVPFSGANISSLHKTNENEAAFNLFASAGMNSNVNMDLGQGDDNNNINRSPSEMVDKEITEYKMVPCAATGVTDFK